MDLAILDRSWRMRLAKLLQHVALASRVIGLLVDRAGVIERTPADSVEVVVDLD
jgi:hypothetical protein